MAGQSQTVYLTWGVFNTINIQRGIGETFKQPRRCLVALIGCIQFYTIVYPIQRHFVLRLLITPLGLVFENDDSVVSLV